MSTGRSGDHVDVLVVGAGPTGLTAACLLGRYGLSVLLVERHPRTSDEAKAISLDDESLRTLQAAGVDQSVSPVIVPGTGTLYLSAGGRPLFHARGPRSRRHGHPFKNAFAQPDLEAALVTALGDRDDVELRFGTELVALDDDGTRVRATLRSNASRTTSGEGDDRVVTAAYVLGCDGGRSTVRELLGIAMRGTSYDDLWLVADTLEDPHDQRYGIHVGDPRRPHVIVPGQSGRCRYEFKLHPGEAVAGPNPPFELVRRLVRTYRDLAPAQLERSVVYAFHALMAERLQAGRCFLLGDAAHMMPPFAGQGLNSGVRDAMNLCWKVAAVVHGTAGRRLLETYETERRPHAEATIALSVRLGEVVMTSSRARSVVRDLSVGAAMRLPLLHRHLTEMRYRPDARCRTGAVVAGDPDARSRWGLRRPAGLVGLALPQVPVLSGATNAAVLLDDALGCVGALVGVDVDPLQWEQVLPHLPPWVARHLDLLLDDRVPRPVWGRDAVADLDGALAPALAPHRGQFLLVRPDRVVAAAFTADRAHEVAAGLARYAPERPPAPTGPLPPGLPVTTSTTIQRAS